MKPDFAAAYSNRGTAKHELWRYEDAIADHDEAIRLKPDLIEAYGHMGESKAMLGLKDQARKDFETVLELARNAGDVDLQAEAERALRDLDADNNP